MPKRRLPLVAAVYLGTFVALLDVSIVNVALPAMQKALRIDFGGLQWVVDAYTLCLSAFMLSAGLIGDRYGRKRSWLAGVGIFVLGSAICAFAPNLPVLLAGRVVQGIAGALLIPGALSILTQAFPDARERAGVIGGWEEALAAEADRLLARGVPDIHGKLSDTFERILISRALAHTRGRRIEAAQALGIGRNAITRKIQELGLEGGKAAAAAEEPAAE